MAPVTAQLVAIAAAALAAVVAAQDDSAARDLHQQKVESALQRARPALLRELRRAVGGELALLCLAATHDRVPPGERIYAAALRRLGRTTLRDTYGLSLRLMVIAQVQDFPDRDEHAQRDTSLLLDNQAGGGGFSYTAKPSNWDLSNTQYAALGLRAAVYLGQPVPTHAWRGLARAALASQRGGGFGYAAGSAPTMSMTVAGIAILELCAQQLERAGEPTDPLERAIEGGWGWMDREPDAVGEMRSWHALYAHYGLERAAVLSGRDDVAGEDWYVRGGRAILQLQLRSGGFRNPGSSTPGPVAVDTAFAVLFLRRAFQRELGPSGPTTPGPTPLCGQLPANADGDAIRRAVELDVARGDTAVADLLAAMRDPLRARRRAAAHALLRISGIDFRYHPDRTDAQNAGALARAEAWWNARQQQRDDGQR